MTTHIDNLWVLALVSKCTQENIAWSLLTIMVTLWLSMTFFCWSHPGGPAWGNVLKRASLNNMMWSVFGQRYDLDETNTSVDELSRLVEQGYDLLGTLNWGDHIPFLKDFDLQKIRFTCSKLVPQVVGSIIADHQADTTQTNRDFVHVLLSLQGPDKLSHSDMIAVLWEMIFRGTDTVAVLIEWIMARMVLHPEVQRRVQEELDAVVGGGARALTEEDVAATAYLLAVVKEKNLPRKDFGFEHRDFLGGEAFARV
ncbi:Cytochrome P450 78A3 [Glycine soja]|nr:Cytochrome P450 78A3 [Glycine soja]